MEKLITFLETYELIYVMEEFVMSKHNVNAMFWYMQMVQTFSRAQPYPGGLQLGTPFVCVSVHDPTFHYT